jgi:hypothetical protein
MEFGEVILRFRQWGEELLRIYRGPVVVPSVDTVEPEMAFRD